MINGTKNDGLRSCANNLHSYFITDSEAARYVDEIIHLPLKLVALKIWRYYVDAGEIDPVNASAETWELVAERLHYDYIYNSTRAE
jgi:hypothetical protein